MSIIQHGFCLSFGLGFAGSSFCPIGFVKVRGIVREKASHEGSYSQAFKAFFRKNFRVQLFSDSSSAGFSQISVALLHVPTPNTRNRISWGHSQMHCGSQPLLDRNGLNARLLGQLCRASSRLGLCPPSVAAQRCEPRLRPRLSRRWHRRKKEEEKEEEEEEQERAAA